MLQLLTLWLILAAWRRLLETRSPQQRRALTLLDSLRDGAAEEFLLLCGLKREMLAQLVLAGLVAVVTETMQAGGATIKVGRYHVTEKGREAIEG
jgi:hypothetical protein